MSAPSQPKASPPNWWETATYHVIELPALNDLAVHDVPHEVIAATLVTGRVLYTVKIDLFAAKLDSSMKFYRS